MHASLVIAALAIPLLQALASDKPLFDASTRVAPSDERVSAVISSITALTHRKPRLEPYVQRQDVNLPKHVQEWIRHARSVKTYRSEVGDSNPRLQIATFAKAYALLDEPLRANAARAIPRPNVSGVNPPQWLMEAISQSEGWYASGMAPEAIRDPLLRRDYETLISIERLRSDYHLWNTCLKDAAHDSLLGFAYHAEMTWGSNWPNSAELRGLLRSAGSDDAAERVISAARKEVLK